MGWSPSINKSVRNRETGFSNRNPSAGNVGAGHERKEKLRPIPKTMASKMYFLWNLAHFQYLCIFHGLVPLSSFSKGSFVLLSSLANEKRNFNAAQGVYQQSMIVIWIDSCCAWVALLENYCAYKSLPLRWSPSLRNKRTWTTTINKDCLDF